MSITNGTLTVSVDSSCLVTVTDLRSSQVWSQYNSSGKTRSALVEGSDYIQFQFSQDSITITCVITLIGSRIEVTLDGTGAITDWTFNFPNGFISPASTYLVAPVNEGVIAPTSDMTAVGTTYLAYYSPYEICLPMFGITDGTHGYMAYYDTPFDAGCNLQTMSSGRVVPRPVWRPEKGNVGYQRKITYYFYATDGSYVKMAQDLRSIFDGNGLAVTLAQKEAENPNVGQAGAWSFWYHLISSSPDAASDLIASYGIPARMCMDSTSSADISRIRENGQLPGKYIVYTDSYVPTDWPTGSHRGGYDPGTSTYSGYGIVKNSASYSGPPSPSDRRYWREAWSSGSTVAGTVTISHANPAVVTLSSHGLTELRKIFFTTTGTLPEPLTPNTYYYVKYVDANTFQLYYAVGAGVVGTTKAGSGTHTLNLDKLSYKVCCSFVDSALETDENNDMAKDMIAEAVASAKYDMLYVDTLTGMQLYECYDPNHPTTRRTDQQIRMNIYKQHYDAGFVMAGEQGAWWAIPYMTWVDGMFCMCYHNSNYEGGSLRGYSDTPPTAYTTYNTGYEFRVPLFELVFHDCAYSNDRWDDRYEEYYSLLKRKELWHILYGIMPLSRPSTSYGWPADKDAWCASVKRVYDAFAQVDAVKMTNHEFLNPSKSQQRTTWENGLTITVDFDAETYYLSGSSSSSSSSSSRSSSSSSSSTSSASSSSSSMSSSSSSFSSSSTSFSSSSMSSSSSSMSSSSSSSARVATTYRISHPQDLQDMNLDLFGNYILDCNINMAGVSWTTIGDYSSPFEGTFDGRGYSISNLDISVDGEERFGAWGTVTGTIENVSFVNCSITAEGEVVAGIVCGLLRSGGQLRKVHVDGGFVVSDGTSGGLAGQCEDALIEQCYSTAAVDGVYESGGLVGLVNGGAVTNCYAAGDVQCIGGSAGGLVGRLIDQSGLLNSYFSGSSVYSDWHSGGLIGTVDLWEEGNDITIQNCYAVTTVTIPPPGLGEPGVAGGLIGAIDLKYLMET